MGMLLTERSLDVWASLVVSYHHPSDTTWAILDSESDVLCYSVLNIVKHALQFARLPSLLPLMVLEHTSSELRAMEEAAFARLNEVRTTIGISPYRPGEVNLELDLVASSVELTKLAQLYTTLGHEYDMLALNVDEIVNFHRDFRARTSSQWREAHDEKWCQLQDRLEYLSRWALLRQQWNANRIAEVQGSIQTVYSLIGSRDNELNFQAAATSARIAELSRKDSSDMRVIAAVTLLFLPATFAATLFSTSFFDFKPQESAHVSSWFWLYWVVTVGLTATVGAAWFLSSRSLAIMTPRKGQMDPAKHDLNL